MEAELCTARISTTLCPELERPVAPDTELKLALKWKILNCHPHRRRHQGEDGDHDEEGGDLGAGEMHAAALGERVAEVARRTTDPVLRQVGLLTEYDHCHRDYEQKPRWKWRSQTSTPSAWVSGLFSSFQRAKSAHEIPSCWVDQLFQGWWSWWSWPGWQLS